MFPLFNSPDIKENRLAMAKRMGADHTLLVTSGDAQSQAQQVRQIMGCMPDITMECSGTQAGLNLGIYVSDFPLAALVTFMILYQNNEV